MVNIGDWSIAERVFVYRGEYAGIEARVEVPFWKYGIEAFDFVTDPKSTSPRNKERIEVSYRDTRQSGTETMLVDFDGGTTSYEKPVTKKEDDEKPQRGQVVTDKASTELILLSPDGKLLVHESAVDTKDEDRVKRHKAWRDWIEEVKHPKNQDPNRNNPGGAPNRGTGGDDR